MTFIHPFYSIVESYWPVYIWWNYFQLDCVTDRYRYHLSSMAITRGTQLLLLLLLLLVEMFGSDRWNGRGHLYFGADIVLVKHHVKWLSNHTVSTYFPDGYTNPIRLFQSRFVHHNLLRGGGGISILTVGRPPGKHPRNRQFSLSLVICNDVGQSHNARLTLNNG